MKKVLSMILVLALVVLALPVLANNNATSIVINQYQDIGYIKFSVDDKEWKSANELIGDYGHRVAFQCSSALFPNASWNYVFTQPDWKTIEKTWIKVQVLVPEGTISRLWVYAWKQSNTYEGGYLMELDPGYYEFSVKNGEAQNWPQAEPYSGIDLARIFQQKRDGNVNVKNPLAFTGITANLVDRIPNDLVYDKIVIGPLSSTKPN